MLKGIQNIVKKALIDYPKSRDNDNYLIMVVWIKHLGGSDIVKDMGAWELLGLLGRDKLINPESIRRCRQKLQEENEDLRGEKYEYRHNRQEDVKEEIKNWSGKLFDF